MPYLVLDTNNQAVSAGSIVPGNLPAGYVTLEISQADYDGFRTDRLGWDGAQFVETPRALDEFRRFTIEQAADTARTDNATYLALTTPTNAQVVAQVRALTRQANGLLRLVLSKFDGTT